MADSPDSIELSNILGSFLYNRPTSTAMGSLQNTRKGDGRLQVQLVEELVRQSAASPIAHFAVSIPVFFLLPEKTPWTLGWLWFASIWAISTARFIRLRQRNDERDFSRTTLLEARFLSCASAFPWGLLPLIIQYNPAAGEEAFILFVLTGLAAGGTAVQSADKFSALSFSLILLLPGTLFCILPAGGSFLLLGIVVFLFVGFLYRTSQTLHHGIRTSREMENERAELLSSLEEKTEKLEENNSFLVQMQEDANRASKAKSQFLARVSHELRTPLNGILGMTEIALDLADDDEQRQCLRVAKDSGNALLHLINDILDLSSIEAGKMKIVPRPFVLNEELIRLEALFRPLANQKGIELNFDWDRSEKLQVVADRDRISQILTNLIGNAIKFTEDGAVRLRLETHSPSEDTIELLFTVSDTGIGIEDELTARIFYAFEQADSTHTRRFGGTGLGLSISQHLAEIMQGSIRLRSTSSSGSVFEFSLPAERLRETRVQIESTNEAIEVVSQSAPVLLVEDNQINQLFAKRVLESAGYRVSIAEDGEEALEKYSSEEFSLILMDCQMPKLDGLQATKRIRSIESEEEKTPIPIIALTAHALDEERERCFEHGMDEFLSKPFKSKALLELVGRFISGKSQE